MFIDHSALYPLTQKVLVGRERIIQQYIEDSMSISTLIDILTN